MSELKLVIFDLDGTLVDSALDFDLMRADLGISAGEPILEKLEAITDPIRKNKMLEIIHQHELEGALRSKIYPGVRKFLKYLDHRDIKKAILTRNSTFCTKATLEKHQLAFEYICTRDDVKFQKPNPEGLFKILNHFSMIACDSIFVGDFTFDMLAAKNAEMKSLYFGEKDEIAKLATERFNDYKKIYSQISILKMNKL
ncbi:MAG: HAD family hydrolase [Bacteriovoracaceae bacterium]|jgi:HAD superfamily hydrolase (TIGR01549 family)|nr:HAD family hydrolase [Bacteriovoracaceae bacterium]